MSNNGRGLMLPGHGPSMPGRVEVIACLPDIQLIAMVASHCTDQPTATDRVEMAMDIIAETMIRHGGLPAKIKARQQQAEGMN